MIGANLCYAVQDGTIWSSITNDEALLQPHLRSALHALFAQTPNALPTAGKRFLMSAIAC